MLPKITHRVPAGSEQRECGILNLDNSTGNGKHCTAWYVYNGNKIYFDSYGLQLPLEMIRYLGFPICYNTDCIQPRDTVVFGLICIEETDSH
jgi:hypothetical protein